ncbi:MAG: septum formation initiator family protein [Treponema sp.]|jgi:cell division protein FtsB|nr:septum formation initiator family protein [Treponema sp.]
MRALKYIIAPWAAAVVYSLFSLFSGTMGFSAYTQLSTERDKQQANMEALQGINKDLEGLMDALRYDSDTLSVYARELGYGSEEERFIRIVGLAGAKKQRILAGQIIRPRTPDSIPDRAIRIFSLSIGLAVSVCLGISDFLKSRRSANGKL